MPKRDEHRSYAAMAGRYALMTAAAATLSLSVVASTAKAEDVCVVKSTDLDFDMLEPLQNAANAKPGPRVVPPRIIPLPTTTSPKFQAIVAAPYRVRGTPIPRARRSGRSSLQSWPRREPRCSRRCAKNSA